MTILNYSIWIEGGGGRLTIDYTIVAINKVVNQTPQLTSNSLLTTIRAEELTTNSLHYSYLVLGIYSLPTTI